MKKFEAPELELLKFDVEDVITTSNEDFDPELGDNQTPPAVRP